MRPTLAEVEKILKGREYVAITEVPGGIRVVTHTVEQMVAVRGRLRGSGISYEDQSEHNVVVCIGGLPNYMPLFSKP